MEELLNDCIEISKMDDEITQKKMFENVLKNAFLKGQISEQNEKNYEQRQC